MAKGFKRKYFSLAAIAATVSAVQISAVASSVVEIEKVVVSASKTLQAEEDVTDEVTVITAEEIERKGYRTLKDAVTASAGIEFASSGGYGQPTSIYLQGLPSDRTLVLIDGIRVNDITGLSGAQFELISLDNVERIEIIKGPQSGIWGADATAGVINIITKGAKEGVRADIKVEGGSYGTKNISLLFAKKRGAFDISLGFDRVDIDGFSAAEPGHSSQDYGKRGDELGWEDDGYENSTMNLKLGYDISDSDRIEASVTTIDATVHFDSYDYISGTSVDAPDGPYTLNNINDRFYKALYTKKTDRHKVDLVFKYSKFDRSLYGGYTGSVKEYEIKDRFDYEENGFLQASIGYQRFYQGLSGGSDLNKDYHNSYVFLTNYNRFFGGKTILTQTLRSDNYDAFEDKVTGKVGIKHYILDNFYLAANYGTGYNVPTPYKLYDVWAGNEELKPEKTKGFNISAGYDNLKVTYFETKIKDFIDYDYATWRYSNLEGTSRFKGFEVSFMKDIMENLIAGVTYTRLNATDSNNEDIPRRAKNKYGYDITWYPTHEHTVALYGYYVGERFDKNGAQTGKYNVTNVKLSHNFAPNFTGFVKIDNLFDRFYQEVDGYGTPGRSFYIGISASY
ncbi:TonB-dependent receptor plug domain-containing protein [Nitrosophilus alvini]|uniref:TonB-dependent receptor plug domain-containing protein n=1 Tax=Nitrosophilus alvini TaxID=2714855 RepID=UPI00190AE466|nr:TonB-dependent receptor [Nitrosophilus alvini]